MTVLDHSDSQLSGYRTNPGMVPLVKVALWLQGAETYTGIIITHINFLVTEQPKEWDTGEGGFLVAIGG